MLHLRSTPPPYVEPRPNSSDAIAIFVLARRWPGSHTDHRRLSGQIESWSAAWNKQYFNQGSPKPDGTSPGLTAPVSGTYDAATGAYVLTWASQVVGGPFNGFTGYWHLQGTFVDARPGSTT